MTDASRHVLGAPGQVSEAWRQEIFGSPPRINVEKNGKSSTRHPVMVGWSGDIAYVNGHERTAAFLLEHLWVEGLVRRWKSQPFNLQEIGGPDATPDFLVELDDRSLHVIEVKAMRFLTGEVKDKFTIARKFLEPQGMQLHEWTNADALSSDTSHTVAELDRGRRFPAPLELIADIAAKASMSQTVGEILALYSWDDVLSAVAHQAFHIDITQPVHEATPILRNHSHDRYQRLFARGNAPASWWNSLASATA